MQIPPCSLQSTDTFASSAYARACMLVVAVTWLIAMLSIGHPYIAVSVFVAVVFFDVMAERQRRVQAQRVWPFIRIIKIMFRRLQRVKRAPRHDIPQPPKARTQIEDVSMQTNHPKTSMNSRPSTLLKTHSVLTFWSEQDRCFIAEAPACMVPVSFERAEGEFSRPEEVEALQGRGASHEEALADALHRLRMWDEAQQMLDVTAAQPVHSSVRAAALSGGRRAGAIALLTVSIAGITAFAWNYWPASLTSRVLAAKQSAADSVEHVMRPAKQMVGRWQVSSSDVKAGERDN